MPDNFKILTLLCFDFTGGLVRMYLIGSELKSDHCHKAKERLTTKIHDVILRIRHIHKIIFTEH